VAKPVLAGILAPGVNWASAVKANVADTTIARTKNITDASFTLIYLRRASILFGLKIIEFYSRLASCMQASFARPDTIVQRELVNMQEVADRAQDGGHVLVDGHVVHGHATVVRADGLPGEMPHIVLVLADRLCVDRGGDVVP
jgi:hypothetical protein